jgi:hypothetical protein
MAPAWEHVQALAKLRDTAAKVAVLLENQTRLGRARRHEIGQDGVPGASFRCIGGSGGMALDYASDGLVTVVR